MAVPWKIVPEEPSFSQSNWETNYSNAVIRYRVPWDDRHEALQTFHGYSFRQGAALKRVLPQSHPDFPWLYANRIMCQGDAFRAKSPQANGFIDRYDELLMDVHYEVRPYTVKSDDLVTKEFERYVRILPQPQTEIIVTDRKVFTFTVDGKQVNQGLPIHKATTTSLWTWYDVPERWLFDSTMVPRKLELMNQRVNNALWNGRASKTLRLNNIRCIEHFAPVSPAIVLGGIGRPPRSWDVELEFVWFENGWHKSLHPTTLEWEAVTAAGGTKELFPTGDFDVIFQAWDA